MIVRSSPAKVNLFLKVLGRRPDGYHELLSLMQPISLCDELVLEEGLGLKVLCPDSPLPVDRGNLVYRAAEAFFRRVAAPPACTITLRKRIPIAAGLGGGSSNAAATLLALNDLHGTPLSREELLQLGTALGADVPFFLYGKTAWATGIGERLTAAPPLPPLWYVLVNPGFAVSTRSVYEGLNWGLTKVTTHYRIPRFYTAEDLFQGLLNDLERVTIGLHPVLADIKGSLLKHGAGGALMSGSGPTVFGIFSDEAEAQRAEQALRDTQPWSVFRANAL